jgi:hypothetical protein
VSPDPNTETQPFGADPIAELLGSEAIRARDSFRSSLRAGLLELPPTLPAQGSVAQGSVAQGSAAQAGRPLLGGLISLGLILGGLLVWRGLNLEPQVPEPLGPSAPANALEDSGAAPDRDAGAFELRRQPPAPNAAVDEDLEAAPAAPAGSADSSVPAGPPGQRSFVPLPSPTAAAPATAPVSPPDQKEKTRPNTPVPPPLPPVEPTYEIPDPGPTPTPHVAAGRPTRTPLATPTGDTP